MNSGSLVTELGGLSPPAAHTFTGRTHFPPTGLRDAAGFRSQTRAATRLNHEYRSRHTKCQEGRRYPKHGNRSAAPSLSPRQTPDTAVP